jgi:hypothetical protein
MSSAQTSKTKLLKCKFNVFLQIKTISKFMGLKAFENACFESQTATFLRSKYGDLTLMSLE